MIKVGNDNKGFIEYNNFLKHSSKTPTSVELKEDVKRILEKNKKPRDENDPSLVLGKQLGDLKVKFTRALEGYKNRERALVERCKFLEGELMKTHEANQTG